MNKIYIAQQMNRAFSLFADNLMLSDSEAMEIADLYEEWKPDKNYKTGKILKWGVNEWGETQLYIVEQAHTSQEDWPPDITPALYKKIGFNDNGIPIWTQPHGAGDEYDKGDKVEHKGKIWVSDIDLNVWEPGVYGWTEVT